MKTIIAAWCFISSVSLIQWILIAFALFVLFVFLKRKRIMGDVKAQLFTLPGIISSMVHALIAVGILSSWVMFNVKVLGNDIALSSPVYER